VKNGLLALLLALTGGLLYAPTAGHGFVYDDEEYVIDNPILDGGWSVATVRKSLTEPHSANWHPLTWWTHLLDRTWFGLEPAGHHLVNVAWFAATAAVLFLAFLTLTQQRWPSFFVALFFVVHPLRVESVAWVSERKDLLSGFFFALCLFAYGRRARRLANPREGAGGMLAYLAVVASLALGLLAKPMLVTVPFVLLLLDYWPLGRWRSGEAPDLRTLQQPSLPPTHHTGISGETGPWRTGFNLVREKWPLFLLVVPACVVTVWAQREFGALSSLATLSLPLRLLNALDGWGFYVEKTFWPGGLACIYPHPGLVEADPIRAIGLRASVWAGVLVLVTTFAVRLRTRAPYLTVGWFWFLGMSIPVIGLVSVGAQAYADRYAYLPTVGLYIAVVFGADALVRVRPALRPPLVGAAVAASLALTATTRAQLPSWKNGEALYTRALQVRERSHVAHNNLGKVLMEEERYEEALDHLEKAQSIRPDFLSPQLNLAQLRRDTGRPQLALIHIQRALAIDPSSARAHAYHALVLRDLGNLPAALRAVERSLAGDPEDAEQLFNRGVILAKLARHEEARRAYERALERQPDFTDALVNLGNLHLRSGALKAAVEELERAVRIAPEFAPARASLGLALLRTGATAQAVRHLRRALEIDAGLFEVAQRLAWILATTSDDTARNPREALRLAERCLQAAGEGQPLPWETLAAALAANGDFDDAIQAQEKALSLLPQARRRKAEHRMSVYRARRALREP
jgi:tetratricopeptide (TPR) repeat protein